MSQHKKSYSNEEIVAELEKMDKQIIHGSDFFLQVAFRIESLLESLKKKEDLLDEAEESLREICLCFGFDPSDGEGTSPEEVASLVRNQSTDIRLIIDNVDKISGFGGHDLTFRELSGMVNEAAKEIMDTRTGELYSDDKSLGKATKGESDSSE